MKIVVIEPEQDPAKVARANRKRRKSGLIGEDMLLIVAVIGFVALTAWHFGLIGVSSDDQASVKPQPTLQDEVPDEVNANEPYAGWCDLNGTLLPPGPHPIGDSIRTCTEGEWQY